MGLAQVALDASRMRLGAARTPVDIISFIEKPWGLGMRLFPVQRVFLKAHYGMALDDNDEGFPLDAPIPLDHPYYDPELVDLDGFYKFRIVISNWRRENWQYLTEAGYIRYLFKEGRCNIEEVKPGHERREMVLSVGRRSGKTLLTSCILAYETYKLLLKGNPQEYYGSSQSNVVQLISVATDQDQAALLYREASGHFLKCDFFKPYMANQTQKFATFQTPYDIEKYGSYQTNNKARYSVNVTFKSCVAKGLRGGANLIVALDEVAHFTDAGQSSADEVYQAVEPSTRTFSPKDPRNQLIPIGENEGRIILISSPLGCQGLFYKQFQIGFTGGKAANTMLCIQAPTWEVNPTVPAETFESSYLKDPRVFDTEFGAKFTDRTLGWIEEKEDLLACVDPTARPRQRALPRVPHFLGLDLGLAGDGTAVAIGHLDEQNRIVVDYVDQIKAGEGDYADLERLEFTGVADWVYDLSRRFYIREGLFDMWSGIPLEQALASKGMKQMHAVQHTPTLHSQMWRNFKDMIFAKQLVLYNWPVPENEDNCAYIDELLSLQAEQKSKYIIKVAAPRIAGKHDDLSDALCRMVWLASQSLGSHTHLAGQGRNKGKGRSSQATLSSMRRMQQTGSHLDRQLVTQPTKPGAVGKGRSSESPWRTGRRKGGQVLAAFGKKKGR